MSVSGSVRTWATRLAGLACLFAVGCATAGGPSSAGPAPAAGVQEAERLLGIEVVAIRWSATGIMLDFRFRVVDPEKARAIMDRSTKPIVIDEASGVKFPIPSSPTVGPMRQTTPRPEAGRVYWLLFANPGRYIKQGNKVTVVIGEVRLEHLTVK